jgi:hypothetical protein
MASASLISRRILHSVSSLIHVPVPAHFSCLESCGSSVRWLVHSKVSCLKQVRVIRKKRKMAEKGRSRATQRKRVLHPLLICWTCLRSTLTCGIHTHIHTIAFDLSKQHVMRFDRDSKFWLSQRSEEL